MDGEVSSGKKNPKSGNSGTLAQEIMSEYNPTIKKLGMLPTPIAGDWKGQRRADGTAWMLSGKASLGMLPTPTANDWKGSAGPSANWKGKSDLAVQAHEICQVQRGNTSQLNPRFVAEMMGFPPNWTELPFLSGEQNQSKATATQ